MQTKGEWNNSCGDICGQPGGCGLCLYACFRPCCAAGDVAKAVRARAAAARSRRLKTLAFARPVTGPLPPPSPPRPARPRRRTATGACPAA